MNINEQFKNAVAKKASDIHLIVDKPVMLRIDGELKPIKGTELNKQDVEKSILSLLTPEQKEKFLVKKDLGFS